MLLTDAFRCNDWRIHNVPNFLHRGILRTKIYLHHIVLHSTVLHLLSGLINEAQTWQFACLLLWRCQFLHPFEILLAHNHFCFQFFFSNDEALWTVSDSSNIAAAVKDLFHPVLDFVQDWSFFFPLWTSRCWFMEYQYLVSFQWL